MIDISNFSKRNLIHFKNNNKIEFDKDIIKIFFDSIQKSYKEYSKVQFSYDIYKIDYNIKQNIDSYYFPLSIQNNIRSSLKYIYKCNIDINHRNVCIYIICKNINDKYEDYMLIIIMWINILYNFSEKECNKSLNIYLYLSDSKKICNNVLTTENINSGYSYGGCNDNNNIVIYRKEEWFKVLIHESMHAFNLDFSVKNNNYINQKLNHIFPLNMPFNSYECYCETWATLWNTMFYSFFQEKNNFNKFVELSSNYFNSECCFTNFQCNKILNIMNIKYEDFLNPNTKYKEVTNIFSYYFLKRICIDNINDFLNICKDNNVYSILKFDEKTYEPFIQLIYDNYRNYLNVINNKKKNNEINHTLRMTLLDFE